MSNTKPLLKIVYEWLWPHEKPCFFSVGVGGVTVVNPPLKAIRYGGFNGGTPIAGWFF